MDMDKDIILTGAPKKAPKVVSKFRARNKPVVELNKPKVELKSDLTSPTSPTWPKEEAKKKIVTITPPITPATSTAVVVETVGSISKVAKISAKLEVKDVKETKDVKNVKEVKEIKEEKKEEIKSVETFEDMNLREELLRGIFAYGFEKPSDIQKKAILPIIKGRDVLAQSSSGLGKSGAFIIGTLQNINVENKKCQVLYLSPTRELAQQTELVIKSLGDYMNIITHACVGGTSTKMDAEILRAGVHCVVCTPGRLYDMIKRGALSLDMLRTLVIDEADEMLSRGFREQIYDIFQKLPADIQVCLFSATYSEQIIQLSSKFLRSPEQILIKNEEVTLAGMKLFYVAVGQEANKLSTLLDIYEVISVSQAIIYCNGRRKVEWLAKQLDNEGFTVAIMHGEMSAIERERIMKDFRESKARVLITTDLISRGIDVQQVSLVVNFDVPHAKESFIHRCGRTARFGRKGVTITFVTDDDVQLIREIEGFYSTKLVELPENIGEFLH